MMQIVINATTVQVKEVGEQKIHVIAIAIVIALLLLLQLLLLLLLLLHANIKYENMEISNMSTLQSKSE